MIDKNFILRKSKIQIQKYGANLQVILSYVKLPHPHLKKKNEKYDKFSKFTVILTCTINLPFVEALKRTLTYFRFMKKF